jgi:hypothetical protein
MRAIVEHRGQKQFRSLERLSCSSISQLGVGQQIWSYAKAVVSLLRHRKRAWRFNYEKVSAPQSRLGDEELLGFPIFESTDRCVNLRLLSAKEVGTALSRIGTGQRPRLLTRGQDYL